MNSAYISRSLMNDVFNFINKIILKFKIRFEISLASPDNKFNGYGINHLCKNVFILFCNGIVIFFNRNRKVFYFVRT